MKARGDVIRAFFMWRCWQWCCLFAGGSGLEVSVMCSKDHVLCWKGKFFRPLNMSYFCKMLCVKGLLILPMFEG